ncbi:MAG: pilus assembly protein PilP [Oxalobacter sp.]|nr:MAG: pilus assembly protein PilP [Oxalobacter sp.]
MKCSRKVGLGLIVIVTFALMGCSQEAQIRDWMEQTKRQTPVSVPKIPEPKTYAPFTYTRKDAIDPFNSVKLSMALAKLRAQSGKGLRPDMERRREPLEQFPLDTVRMVGTLERPGLAYAILQVDKAIFQVKVGNYVGQNFGMVTGITEDAVELKEIVQDASGEWVERKARLELQESKK